MTDATDGLRVRIMRKTWPAAGADAQGATLQDVDFSLLPGETACLLGPSGSGKSTLLSLIAGLDHDYEGSVEAPPGRLSVVFQQPRLLPWRTLLENILLVPGAEEATARRLLAEVGLTDFMHAHPERVSLGMQRRAALARALSIAPSLVLMDEPLASLDPDNAAAMRGLATRMLWSSGATALIATHDRREALAMADRILELGGTPTRLVADRRSPLPRERRDAAAIEGVYADWFGPSAASKAG